MACASPVPPRPVSVLYDRADSAAAALIPDDIDWAVVESARAVHLTGITPALSPSARLTTMETARRAGQGDAEVIVDVNYRSRSHIPRFFTGNVIYEHRLCVNT